MASDRGRRTVVRPYDRREVLFIGAAAIVSSGVLKGCDVLVLPDGGTGGSIPPITPNDEFYVQSCCGTPSVDPDSWTMVIRDRGTEVATLDRAALLALPGREREHTLECIGTSPSWQQIGNAIWTGLPLQEVLDELGVEVPAEAIEMKFTGADGYTTSIPIGDLASPVWLVWEMNGEPLPADHGAPARLLTPGRYGTKNPKWITELDLVDEPYLGYWEQRDWSNTAEYNANTLIASPAMMASLEVGAIRLLGTAFAGTDPAEEVEVSTDGGDTWEQATLDYAPGPDIWTLWSHDWLPAEPGTYLIQVRLTTRSGAVSGGAEATDRHEGWDGSMQIEVEVR